jgi:hypothetical protein
MSPESRCKTTLTVNLIVSSHFGKYNHKIESSPASGKPDASRRKIELPNVIPQACIFYLKK